MADLFRGLESRGESLKIILILVCVFFGMIGAAALVYTAKTTFSPVAAVLKWMFAYKSGERNDLVDGVSFGARMLAWAAIVGLVVSMVYYAFHH